jgi:predicted CXXCH cytochrome family protein
MLMTVSLASFSLQAASVVNSVHNLSSAGPGAIRATTESDACVFCHTVHKTTGQNPLWSHGMSGITNYIVYSSPTMKAVVGQPDGASRLCLSCHDGTVALGMVSSRGTIQMQGDVTKMPSGHANLGTDLSGDHPISFVYDAKLTQLDPTLRDPSTLDHRVKLDHHNELQCTACHDPHDNQFGNFLVMDNTGSVLCLTCHVLPNWSSSTHAASTQPLPPAPLSLFAGSRTRRSAAKTVAENGCANCHDTHFAGSRARLMKNQVPEDNCFSCHGGKTTLKDISSEFQKASIHPITRNTSAHSPMEDPINPAARHVTCSDCHDPHASAATTAIRAPLAVASSRTRPAPSLAHVAGESASGARIKLVSKEYELCFRCHADSQDRGPAFIRRRIQETNKRILFNPANQSYHPVETTGKNPFVPSLVAPWSTGSVVGCSDCHNSDAGPGTGGGGPNGPHGSAFAPLLERELLVTDSNPESAANYALCYKCHSRDNILANQSFNAASSLGQERGHRFHIADQKTACTTCHDSHGVANSKNLINFNVDYVTPSASNGRLEYLSTGQGSGVCSLTCHGFDHSATSYPVTGAAAMRRHR